LKFDAHRGFTGCQTSNAQHPTSNAEHRNARGFRFTPIATSRIERSEVLRLQKTRGLKNFVRNREKTCPFFSELHSRRNRAPTFSMNFSFPFISRQYFFAIVLLTAGLLFLSPNSASAQIVFSQNFSGGTNVSDYVGSGANLFDAISTANSTNLSWSINSGTLQGDRTLNSTGRQPEPPICRLL